MATTITGDWANGDNAARVTMNGTGGNATAVTFPNWCKSVMVRFRASDGTTDEAGEYSHTGTDGAAMGTEATPVPSGAAIAFNLRRRLGSAPVCYLAGTTSSGFAYCTLSDQPVT